MAARGLGIAPPELARIIAPALGLRETQLDLADPAAATLLPERIARQYHVWPLYFEGRRLIVATFDPTNLEAEHSIGFATGRRPEFVLASPSQVEEGLIAAYGEAAIDQLLSTIDEEMADVVRVVDDASPDSVSHAEVDSAPVVKLANLILRDAVVQGASDVHIEPGLKSGVVRFRVDGVMRRYMQVSLLALNRVVSRVKVLGKMDIADRIRPQDGRSRVIIDGHYIDLRISTVCTRDAEKAVIRILRPETTRKLDDIGVLPRELGRLRQLLACRAGIVIVSGPTGSGKTTTLYSALREIATDDVNISTVEDPVEYELGGITQIQIDPRRGITFANSLRALLRQDPDVIFVGEIRDGETAHIAAQAALTGHLVLATLHTNDAMSAVTRLSDLGLDRQTIAATLRGTISQRLVRRVCADCAQPLRDSFTEGEERLGARFGVRPLVRPMGCKACGHSGYRGRVPVIEVAVVTPTLAEMIADGASALALTRAAVAEGMVPMRDIGIARMMAGETTLQEVERVIGDSVLDQPERGARGGAVLLVNPDAAWRRATRALLERDDVRVVEAADAGEAMRLMSSGEQFALMLTDLVLPVPLPGHAGDTPELEHAAAEWMRHPALPSGSTARH